MEREAMKNFILKHSRLLMVLLISSIGLSSCVVHEASHRNRRPVVIVQENPPGHAKHHNKNKHKKHKKDKRNHGHNKHR